MDEFTQLALGALSDFEQMETDLREGNVAREPEVRELLKRLIDVSDGPKLQFWLRVIEMVASKAAEGVGDQ